MPQIMLTPERLRVVTESQGPVDVVDEQGRPLASMSLLTAEDLQDIERYKRMRDLPKGTLVPGERVGALLRRLDELDASEGINEAKLADLLRRTVAGEPL